MKSTRIAAALLFAAACTPTPAQSPLANPEGVYGGSYRCADGEHGFFLEITETGPDGADGLEVSGVLGFFPVLGGADGALAEVLGSFMVSGSLDGEGRILLLPGDWLIQPSGYRAANLEGRLAPRADGALEILGRPVIPGNEAFCFDLIATRFLPPPAGQPELP